ncbi:hypothetical protein LOK46_13665 [Methylobacterium sp. NMS14P]|uniref:hypothetical protein n=1 Tax=Methylobacterium sp. NMS14P TaxID=2894310 RepID=UPI002359FDBE|nr:hypothetical protein [Methylobacterium sp. NMS14P]WCS27823.1 hypothetical protein LOK46_13665 [Methylobacterium sp. NMS14P]
MSAAADRPTLASEILARVVAALDAGAAEAGLPTYSALVAENALHTSGFEAAVHERAVGLVRAENWRLRIALMVVLQDVLALQALLAKGQQDEAALAVFAMLPELRAAAHRMKLADLPADVASLEAARERRDGAR